MFSPLSSMDEAYCWRLSSSELFEVKHWSKDSIEYIFPLRLECEERGLIDAEPSVLESSKGLRRFRSNSSRARILSCA